MVEVTELVKYFVAIIFGILVIMGLFVFGGEGMVGKVKEAILGLKDFLPKFSFGLEEQKAEVSIPDEHRAEIVKLKQTINSMLGQGKENCFAQYTAFSDLGEKGTSLQFKVEGDKTLLTVYAGAGGKQIMTDLSGEISGMKPCVVAGTSRVSEHFFKHFLQGKQDLIYPYYQPVTSLTIFYTTSGNNGNRISVPDLDLENHFDDNGWLFTPDGEKVCFFPTNLVSDYDESGIDNDYFTPDEANSVGNKIKRGELKLCG
ncbi:MAG TPA: hypothetical protein VJB13_03785 [Candidatus Nanoarchaeia archaeon]|nr:hypothetical protein [Candidatus Nanoarchaeia archaeon]